MSIGRCRSCGARIIWCSTVRGKSMPVDWAPSDDGNLIIDGDGVARVIDLLSPKDSPRHKSHFATCPDADEHRKG